MTETQCYCYKSKTDLNTRCPHKAKLPSKYCGTHQTCVEKDMRWVSSPVPTKRQVHQQVEIPIKRQIHQPLEVPTKRQVHQSLEVPTKHQVHQPIESRPPSPTQKSGCVKQTTAKYLNRPGPPYPANQCCGQVMIGNDGQSYISRMMSNHVCTWRKL